MEQFRRNSVNGNCLGKTGEMPQYIYATGGKNLWDNCARILYTKSDDELRPYLSKLLEWIQDLNWPGAMTILERLQQFDRDEVFIAVVGEFKRCAQAIGDEIWLNTLTELLNI